jgi:signal transduction histidine kinase/CheY-like chemotaxis protein
VFISSTSEFELVSSKYNQGNNSPFTQKTKPTKKQMNKGQHHHNNNNTNNENNILQQQSTSDDTFGEFYLRTYRRLALPVVVAIILITSYMKPKDSKYSIYWYWTILLIHRGANYLFNAAYILLSTHRKNIVDFAESGFTRRSLVLGLQYRGVNVWSIVCEVLRSIWISIVISLSYIICTKDSPVYLFAILFVSLISISFELYWKYSLYILLVMNQVSLSTIVTMYYVGCSVPDIMTVVVILYLVQTFSLTKSKYMSLLHQMELMKQTALRDELIRSKEEEGLATKSKADFVATISHEMRSPLVSICGMTELMLQESDELSAKHIDFLKTLQASSSMLRTLINDILDLSKLESNKLVLESHGFCILDSAEIVKRCVFDSLGKEKNITCNLIVDQTLRRKHLIGDLGRLNQILINLTNNSIKFTPREGVVELSIVSLRSLKCLSRNRAHLYSLTPGLFDQIMEQTENESEDSVTIVCAVKDSGAGIPKSRFNELFQRFTRLSRNLTQDAPSTGLGLSICKSLVDMMQGKFYVESEEGKGSIFAFTAVFKQSPEDYIRRKSIIPDLPTEVLTYEVLVVDDSIVNQKVMVNILKKLGISEHGISVAGNGAIACNMIDEKIARTKKCYDVIFMDLNMPVMNGHAAIKRIRQTSSCERVPIIALTADTTDSAKQSCLRAGADTFCTKPYTMSSIVALLTGLVENKYTTRSAIHQIN